MNFATIGWFIGHEITHGKHAKLAIFNRKDFTIQNIPSFKALTILGDSWMQRAIYLSGGTMPH